ncbi:hypothetical protein N0V90_009551 [Kalmusia sp. IMI 367209]|nr:hypothetical protein N0V90_009551 [Kalmusia sp. IMI 367209]
MSASGSSSDSITVGKSYEDMEKVEWDNSEAESKASEETEEEEVPEGGVHAWLTVVGSTLIYFASFGIINSFGFFQNYYEHNFLLGVPASTISFVGTVQIMLGNVLAAPAGALFDCYGLKIFLVQGILLGVANALGTQPALVVVGQHFVRRRAFVMGIVAAAGSVGGVCFPVIFAQLADPKRVGFAWSLRVVAGITA